MLRKINRPRALVTGGAGFIGVHLCRRLLTEGYDVLCVDNLFTSDKSNIAGMMSNPYFEFIRHDITKPLRVEVDVIYNLACPASPKHYQHDPIQTVRANVHGAINMLGLAKRLNVPIFQASTSEVYGDPKVTPIKEEYWGNVNPIGPRSCYDEGKRCAETLFFDYHRQHGLEIKVARIFNVYGPYMQPNDGRLIPNFIISALKGEDLTVNGDGSQTRAFCYVDDLIDAIMLFMKTRDFVTGPMNIGNPEERTILEMAEIITKHVGNGKTSIVHRPLPQDDPMQRNPDITFAKNQLGWKPRVSLDEGLEKTIDYFKSIDF